MQTNKPGNRAIFTLAWPIAMNAVLLQLILIIDTVLVTPLGEESLAAMGLAASIAGIILGLLFAFSNGTQLIIAQAYGAKNGDAISMGLKAGLAINLGIAVLGILFIFTLGLPLITMLAETTSMAALSYDYLNIFTLVIIGIAGCQNLSVFFNATGNSRYPFYANLVELPVNVLVSLVLIYGWWGFPEMGLTGAAMGSVVAVLCRLVFLITFKRRQTDTFAQTKPINLTVTAVRSHLAQATPIAGTFVSMVLANSVCMMIYARLGINQFAALTLITPWVKVAGHITTAWAQATGILVGQLLGGKVWDWLDQFISQSWRIILLLGGMVAAIYLGMFYLFEALYPELQEETLSTLWQFMPILVAIPVLRASNTICGHVLRAGGDAVHVFKIHSTVQWLVVVPLSALFVLYLELSAVWVFGLILLEEVIKSVPFHRRMYQGQWKKSLT